MFAILWPLLIYWLVLFVVCSTITQVAQDQLYDAVTPRVGLKVALGSFLLAVLLTWLHPTFETMFTSHFAWTVLQGIVWFAVFTLIFQFHPQHAAALGILTMLIIPGVATLGVDSILKPRPRTAATSRAGTAPPLRRALGPVPGAANPELPTPKK
jgi:hypothetical protein